MSRRIIYGNLITGGLTVLLVLILSSGAIILNKVIQKKDNKLINAPFQPKKTAQNVKGAPIQDLSTLENKDAGFTVNYPTDFKAMYTQTGVEFTPKNGEGKIILQVKDQIVNVSIQQDQTDQSQLLILNNAAETIKNTLRFVQPLSTDKNSNQGRFSNIYFNPKRY